MVHNKFGNNKIMIRMLMYISILVCITIANTYFRNENYHVLLGFLFFLFLNFDVLKFNPLPKKWKRIYSVKLLLSIILSSYLVYRNILFFPDSFHYLKVLNKMNLASDLTFSSVSSIAGSYHVSYHYWNFVIYKIFQSTIAISLSNITLYNISIILLDKILKGRFSAVVRDRTIVFYSLSIYLFIFTSLILKDSFVLFITIFSLCCYDRSIVNKKIYNVVILLVSLFLLTTSRIYSGLAISLGIMIDYIFRNKHFIKKHTFVFIFGIVISVLAFTYTPLNGYIKLGISFITKFEVSFSLILKILKSSITVFFSPFLWNMLSQLTIYSPIVIESSFLLLSAPCLFFYFVKVFKKKEFRKNQLIFLIPMIFHVLVLGLQYGETPIRQRIAVYPFVLLFFSQGYNEFTIRRSSSNTILDDIN